MEILDNLQEDRQKNFSETIQLLRKLETDLSKKKFELSNSQNNVHKLLGERRIDAYKERIRIIQKIIGNTLQPYKLIFVGVLGVGKTTAICHLFDLISGDKTLFSTGSGRTTICEVEIKSGNENASIEIERSEDDYVEELIKQFLDSFLEEDSLNPLTTESERLIRNFLHVPISVTKEKQGIDPITKKEKYKTITIDPLKNDIEKIKKANDEFITKEEWHNKYIKKAKLSERNETKISCNSKVKEEEQNWLLKEFKEINEGKNPKFSYPKKIIVTLPEEHYNTLSYFDAVVDSKGLDKNEISRKDIDEFIRESEQSIVLFISSYNNAPDESIRVFMQQYLSEESRSFHQRFGIMVLPKNDEPQKENGANGDWEAGIVLKHEIVYKDIIQKNREDSDNGNFYKFKEENILFYDVLKKNEEDFNYKEETLTGIYKIIFSREKEIKEELERIEKSIKNVDKIDKETEFFLKDKERQLSKNTDLNIDSTSYITELIEYFLRCYPHWKTRKAIADRDGIFGQKDTFYDVEVFTKLYLTKQTQSNHKFIEELFIYEQEKEVLFDINKQIKSYYDEYISFISRKMRDIFKQIANSEFWSILQYGPYGRERFKDVMTHLLYNLNSEMKTFNHTLKVYANAYWKQNYIGKIQEFIKMEE